MKSKIKKCISKYISFLFVFLLIPCFSINTSAAESFYNTITPPELADLNANLGSNNVLSSDGLNAQSLYEFNNTTTYTASSINFIYPDSWNLDFNPDLYDYYLTLIFDSYSGTFAPNFIRITSYTSSGSANHNLTDVVIDSISGRGSGNVLNGYHIIGKIPDTFNGNFRSVYVSGTSGTIGKYLCAYISITQVNKGTDTAVAESIISAINNQTSVLGGQLGSINSGIDKGNDLIENGTDDTQSVITDFNEVFEDFNNELDSLEQFDDDIIGEFNAANENYKTELSNFSLSGSLLNAGNWLSTSMQTVYDNSSDYKMIWIVPLLFGIPILLFVIKKDKESE